MAKIGLITFHSAYNFGSVLQAYATQVAIQQLGFEVEVINYRSKTQRAFYERLYRTDFGLKHLLNDLSLAPAFRKRDRRNRSFEDFIRTKFSLSKEISTISDLDNYSDRYNLFISGSDQVWNKHANELETVPWEYMKPYLLSFTDNPKISYASSVANMSNDEIKKIREQLLNFQSISMREKTDAVRLSKILNKPVTNVLDPTLLLTKDEWRSALGGSQSSFASSIPENFVLYYSLSGTKGLMKARRELTSLAKRTGCKVLILSPFGLIPSSKYCECVSEAGPLEFVELIRKAKLIVTDSYHGTLFSINFHKQFYSISNSQASNKRKDQVLEQLNLLSRRVPDLEGLSSISFDKIDYSNSDSLLQRNRDESINYLKTAILGAQD